MTTENMIVKDVVDSLIYALKQDEPKITIRRILLNDFLVSLARKKNISNDECIALMQYCENRVGE